MYTGTLIRDLLTTVERAEQRVRQKQFANDRKLPMLFGSQAPLLHDEPVFVGAA